ncbi:hypothetical protein FE263_02465 [Lichenicoccus roseus]|uniref:Glutathione synthetase n=2 Tax=Lichenicoccus roseus TaxID=2683649 RepID=A0A5R9JFA5_9PROT|nr:hypothetical protein FE263_02465 [Lichenicoccus roseus]
MARWPPARPIRKAASMAFVQVVPACNSRAGSPVANACRRPSMQSSQVVTIVSLFAATLSMVSFVPQAWGIIRSRNTDGISLKTYLITVIGFVTWLLYGFLLMQWAIIVQNIICLCLSAFILMMKMLPQRKKEVVADALTPDFLSGEGG